MTLATSRACLSAEGATGTIVAATAAPAGPRLPASIRRTVADLGPEWALDGATGSPTPKTTVAPQAISQAQGIEVNRATAIASRFEARVREAYSPPSAEVSATLRGLNDDVDRVKTAGDAMRAALRAKGIDPSNQYGVSQQNQQLPLDRWLSEMHRWTRSAGGSLPILKSSRLNRLKELRDKCLPAASAGTATQGGTGDGGGHSVGDRTQQPVR